MGAPTLPIRTVAMRDALQMQGDHHVWPGRRDRWRATASAFAITDAHRNPLLWIEGDYVTGDIGLVCPSPLSGGVMEPGFTPRPDETLLWFEVVAVGGSQMIRTWWAVGPNIRRTQRLVRLEPLTSAWPERVGDLIKIMTGRN